MNNSFRKNLVLSYSSVIFVSIISFISVPMSLKYFGKDLYGVFSLTSDTLAYLGLFNFGIPWAVSTIFAQTKSYRIQKKLILRALILLLITSCTLALIITLYINYSFDWIGILGKIPPYILQDSKKFVLISILFFLIKLPLTLFNYLLIFLNKVYISKIFDVINSVISFIILFLIIKFRLSIVSFAYFTGILSLILGCLSLISFFKVWVNNSNKKEEIEGTNKSSYLFIAKSSFYFFINSIAGLIIWNTDNLVISHYLGVGEVTKYSVIFKVFLILFSVITQIMNIINPLYPNYIKNNELSKLKDLYELTNKLFPIIGGFIFIFMYGFLKEFIFLWTGNSDIFAGYPTVFAIGLYCYFLCCSVIPYSAIVSLNHAKLIYRLTLLEAIINFILSITLINYIGIAGVALGTLLSHIFTMFLFAPGIIYKITKKLLIYDFNYILKHFLLILVPIGAILFFLNDFTKVILLKIVFIIILSLIYSLFSYILLDNKTKEKIIYNLRTKKFQ